VIPPLDLAAAEASSQSSASTADSSTSSRPAPG
jgi:hypothetical protein